MGGKLFNLGRMPAAEYHALELDLRGFLDAQFGDFYRIPRYYRQKPDFGDMDILISQEGLKGNWQDTKELIIKELGISEHKTSGHIFSTAHRGLQTDFFICDAKYFLSTYNFLCWNDVGNLLGKMFRRFNLKYGEQGLQYVFRREDGHYQKDILITLDIHKILSFLQLDSHVWESGFDTLDDIYAWVVSSPYFSIQPYLLEDNAPVQRRIKQERTTVIRFVEYLKKQGITTQYQHPENRDEYLPFIANFFRDEVDLQAEIAKEEQRETYLAAIREKFNGKLLMQWFPALSGKELGTFITEFKQQWADEASFEVWAYAADAAEIAEKAANFYQRKS